MSKDFAHLANELTRGDARGGFHEALPSLRDRVDASKLLGQALPPHTREPAKHCRGSGR